MLNQDWRICISNIENLIYHVMLSVVTEVFFLSHFPPLLLPHFPSAHYHLFSPFELTPNIDCSTSTLLNKLNYTSPFEIVQFWMLLMLSTWTQSQSWLFWCFNSSFSLSSFHFLFLSSWNTCSFLLLSAAH